RSSPRRQIVQHRRERGAAVDEFVRAWGVGARQVAHAVHRGAAGALGRAAAVGVGGAEPGVAEVRYRGVGPVVVEVVEDGAYGRAGGPVAGRLPGEPGRVVAVPSAHQAVAVVLAEEADAVLRAVVVAVDHLAGGPGGEGVLLGQGRVHRRPVLRGDVTVDVDRRHGRPECGRRQDRGEDRVTVPEAGAEPGQAG